MSAIFVMKGDVVGSEAKSCHFQVVDQINQSINRQLQLRYRRHYITDQGKRLS